MDPVIEKAREVIAQLEEKIQALQNKLDSILSKIPWGLGWIADKIHDGWNSLVGKLDEFWSWVDETFNNAGSPSRLSEAAQSWNEHVGGPVSSQSGVVDAGQLTADDLWSGTAADAYRQAVSPQKAAMDKVKSSLCDGVFQALDKMQSAIIIFWTAFAAGVAACIVGFIGALASAATIFGAPASPFIAGGAVLVLMAALGGGMLKLKADINSSKGILTGKLNDLSAFPGGRWPKAVGL